MYCLYPESNAKLLQSKDNLVNKFKTKVPPLSRKQNVNILHLLTATK